MSLNEDFRSDLEDKSMRSGTDPQKPSCSNRMPKHNSGYSFSDQDAEIMIKCNNEGSYKRGGRLMNYF